jgi:miniconductance mechanosensitive channel
MNLDHWARDWFIKQGISADIAAYFTVTLDVIILLLASFILDRIAKRIILRVVKTYVKRTKNEYDDIFLEKKVFNGLAHLVPAGLIYNFVPYIFDNESAYIDILLKLIGVYVIFNVLAVASRFFRSLETIGLSLKRFEGKPVSSYIQLFIIIVYMLGIVLIISTLFGKEPQTILAGFGAATAVILLIFRDTILGLVASIQISSNDMVKLGDWVGLEKFGADGNVIEINLTTVKIKNWDKTITTVPTYAFISDSFKNWRGMENTGLRRIKRSVNIDLSSVKFVTNEMYQRYLKYSKLSGYLLEKKEEIDAFNQKVGADKSEVINGRQLTNLGIFRRYALKFLEDHPQIDQKETVMVRQLQSTETGIPLEIYAFSTDIAWVNYENIQSDIFDHLLASIPEFDLKVFQNPTGADFKKLNA